MGGLRIRFRHCGEEKMSCFYQEPNPAVNTQAVSAVPAFETANLIIIITPV
jgi:hypothetical protein